MSFHSSWKYGYRLFPGYTWISFIPEYMNIVLPLKVVEVKGNIKHKTDVNTF